MSAATLNLISNTGTIEVTNAPPALGTVAGYIAGGNGASNVIARFPFASDTNATSVGVLTVARSDSANTSSQVATYSSGGYTSGATELQTIERLTFASATPSVTYITGLINDYYVSPSYRRGHTGVSSPVSGYFVGGTSLGTSQAIIDKFSFATQSSSSMQFVGNVTNARYYMSGQNSDTSGYVTGGILTNTAHTDESAKFPFATDTNATNVLTLTQAKAFSTGISNATYGYQVGGQITPPTLVNTDTINRFPFASNVNATNVASLNTVRSNSAGFSSTASGYVAQGYNAANPTPSGNNISKFSFASESTSSSVGTVSYNSNRQSNAGSQD